MQLIKIRQERNKNKNQNKRKTSRPKLNEINNHIKYKRTNTPTKRQKFEGQIKEQDVN